MGSNARRETVAFYMAILPWLVGFLIFTLGPMVASMYLSFTRWDLLTPPRWNGLDNYMTAFTNDRHFWAALVVTTKYALFSIPLNLGLALAVAILLNQVRRGVNVLRVIYFLPSVVAGVPVVVLWAWIFNPEFGLFNWVLSWFGIEGPRWLLDPDWALTALIIMSAWSFGAPMIIFLAGLKNIPPHLYEAAEIDGGGTWAKFRYVTVPMLSPTIFFNLVLGVIGAMQAFTQSYVSTGGGPQDSTLFYVLYLYQNAFIRLRMGYASALAWILFVIIVVLTLLIIRSSALWVYYEGEKA
jgi:multiple sugar transport system permease protein